eukprot:gnl/TRDRNA2_/TRDRNA2_90922_c0_seq1.p1 gnl/TRDRNA2_/TRDRNA2_90922_c0~~gnl/TRDRNA2_/TRDRNA2_90922_c0_seq1.p1  ORF type:complete len:345 (+),score=72.87 gnl/TRDRNA2_/TRDRNA2_90922_c0_seq1:77-1036(+)
MVPAGQVFFGSLPSEGATKRSDRADRAQREKQVMMPPPGNHHMSSPSSSQGPISQLQEFVQGSKKFPAAPHRQILQWDFAVKQSGAGAHMFCATVAFLLEGVPHHAAGTWQSSKKLAQRDSAERALGLFVGRWGEMLSMEDQKSASSSTTFSRTAPSQKSSSDTSQEYEVQVLEDFCGTSLHQLSAGREAASGGGLPAAPSPPVWHTVSEGNFYQAFVQVDVLGVPHTFPGAVCHSPEAARTDTARRTLWYLQCPGYEDAFELDTAVLEQEAIAKPPASACWHQRDKDGSDMNEGQQQQQQRGLRPRPLRKPLEKAIRS